MSGVLDLYSHYVDGLKRGSGENYIGCCPIHGEIVGKSKPSFSVNIETGLWCCFSGCGGGGLKRFLREMGKSRDYIDKTMTRLGPLLREVSKKKSPVDKGGLFQAAYKLPEKILGLFDQCPTSMLQDGFTEDILWSHDIGYDTEYDRVTYPIRDINGALAGIVGRNLQDGPKYKVYRKEIDLMGFRNYEFDNHFFVWRGDRVYAKAYHSEKPSTLYVTEGYKTCLWLVQHGYENTVCLMGSSLSVAQKVFLERLGGTIVLCLDNDKAGLEGTDSIGYKVKGSQIRVLDYPSDIRQLDQIKEPDALHQLIQNNIPYDQWRRHHGRPRYEFSQQRAD